MATAVITDAGIAAVVAAQGDGFAGVTLDTLRVTDHLAQTHDLALAAVSIVSPGVIQVAAQDQTGNAYTALEIDVLTSTEVVFAEIRREAGEASLYVKAAATSALLSYQVVVAAAGEMPVIPSGGVSFTSQAATTARAGVSELATDEEAVARDAGRVLTGRSGGALVDAVLAAALPVELFYNAAPDRLTTLAVGTEIPLLDSHANYRYIELIGVGYAGRFSQMILVENLPSSTNFNHVYGGGDPVRFSRFGIWTDGANLRGRVELFNANMRIHAVRGHRA